MTLNQNMSSPTPSQENLSNSNDASVYDAIDTFMSKDEQSYDDFMKGFLYLKKEDVKTTPKLKPNLESSHVAMEIVGSAVSSDHAEPSSSMLPTSEDELEVEMLENGTPSSVMASGADVRRGSMVKFDNFVDVIGVDSDSDDSEIDELMRSSSYVASFGSITEAASEESTKEVSEETVNTDQIVTGSEDEELTVLYPGEIEEVPQSPRVKELQNIRQLDFSANFGDVPKDSSQIENQVCTDEVQPFSLDDQFDYDNVILTPKFSAEEIRELTCISHNSSKPS